jgi:hypothetical protein
MRVNWVLASTYQLDPVRDPEHLKTVGPIWGSWHTWRSCGTDNVVCHEFAKSRELIQRAFQAVCNFYVPRQFYQDLGRPIGIKLYDGNFQDDVDHIEDIVSMHLAASVSDIVLLLGFDLAERDLPQDRLERHRFRNYRGLLKSVIAAQDRVQWVAVDHAGKLEPSLGELSNLTCDTMQNALQLLI